MIKLFLDSNVILDALIDRGPSHGPAKLLLALGYIGEFEMWVSPSQWTDLFYILSEGGKQSRGAVALSSLREVGKSVRVSTMGEDEIDRAMALNWSDFEDAVVYESARAIKPFALITNNKGDFALSRIPLYSPEEFFDWLKNEHGTSYAEIAFNDGE